MLRAGAAGGSSTACPSFACLDVKMYSFLNSQSCICSVGDLERLRGLGVAAVAHLKVALIGAPRPVPCVPCLHPHTCAAPARPPRTLLLGCLLSQLRAFEANMMARRRSQWPVSFT